MQNIMARWILRASGYPPKRRASSELRGLTWRDIDFAAETPTVRAARRPLEYDRLAKVGSRQADGALGTDRRQYVEGMEVRLSEG
jgi:integrase